MEGIITKEKKTGAQPVKVYVCGARILSVWQFRMLIMLSWLLFRLTRRNCNCTATGASGPLCDVICANEYLLLYSLYVYGAKNVNVGIEAHICGGMYPAQQIFGLPFMGPRRPQLLLSGKKYRACQMNKYWTICELHYLWDCVTTDMIQVHTNLYVLWNTTAAPSTKTDCDRVLQIDSAIPVAQITKQIDSPPEISTSWILLQNVFNVACLVDCILMV